MSLIPVAPLLRGDKRAKVEFLWDITKPETTLGNVPNARRNMSASRARSSLRAMLRLAKERRRANNAVATRSSYSGWHFAGVAKSAAHYQYNAVAPALRPTPQDRATRCVPRGSRADISSLCHPAHSPSANTKSPLPTATKDLLSDLFCGSRQNLHTEQSEEPCRDRKHRDDHMAVEWIQRPK